MQKQFIRQTSTGSGPGAPGLLPTPNYVPIVPLLPVVPHAQVSQNLQPPPSQFPMTQRNQHPSLASALLPQLPQGQTPFLPRQVNDEDNSPSTVAVPVERQASKEGPVDPRLLRLAKDRPSGEQKLNTAAQDPRLHKVRKNDGAINIQTELMQGDSLLNAEDNNKSLTTNISVSSQSLTGKNTGPATASSEEVVKRKHSDLADTLVNKNDSGVHQKPIETADYEKSVTFANSFAKLTTEEKPNANKTSSSENLLKQRKASKLGTVDEQNSRGQNQMSESSEQDDVTLDLKADIQDDAEVAELDLPNGTAPTDMNEQTRSTTSSPASDISEEFQDWNDQLRDIVLKPKQNITSETDEGSKEQQSGKKQRSKKHISEKEADDLAHKSRSPSGTVSEVKLKGVAETSSQMKALLDLDIKKRSKSGPSREEKIGLPPQFANVIFPDFPVVTGTSSSESNSGGFRTQLTMRDYLRLYEEFKLSPTKQKNNVMKGETDSAIKNSVGQSIYHFRSQTHSTNSHFQAIPEFIKPRPNEKPFLSSFRNCLNGIIWKTLIKHRTMELKTVREKSTNRPDLFKYPEKYYQKPEQLSRIDDIKNLISKYMHKYRNHPVPSSKLPVSSKLPLSEDTMNIEDQSEKEADSKHCSDTSQTPQVQTESAVNEKQNLTETEASVVLETKKKKRLLSPTFSNGNDSKTPIPLKKARLDDSSSFAVTKG